ncbi:MAG: YceI family protein [Thermoleophilia bacterium]|nr:YceI family protein [Gaiellaceae bacterium]MDW8338966.1 YceI family protein [Thermoleophilia bacterium]
MSIVTETSSAVIPAGTWEIDPAHSSVEFEIRHLGLATVKGRAPAVSGTITGGDAPSIVGSVDATALTTFDEQRDAHLRSPEFFDVERYPELRFASTAVVLRGSDLVVEGELTMRGVTKPVTLTGAVVGPASDPWGNERIGIDLEAAIDRTEWGITWNAPLPDGGTLLPNEVRLTASFSAIKKA